MGLLQKSLLLDIHSVCKCCLEVYMHSVENSIQMLISLLLVCWYSYVRLRKGLLFLEDFGQSGWFEKAVETFTSGGSGQSLHIWGGTIHAPSTPASFTAVNTCVKIGVSGVPLQWPAVTEESSHGIAVGTSSLTAVLYEVTNHCRCKEPSLDLTSVVFTSSSF